jgi:hypothetical protein
MTRIAAEGPDDFQFRTSDTPEIRTQKLELLRLSESDVLRRLAVLEASVLKNVQWVRQAATGRGNGSTFDNAAAFADLPMLMADAPPGSTIGMYSGDQFQATRLELFSSNGTATNPVTVMGVDGDGNPSKVTIKGTRTAFAFPANSETVTSVVGWTTGENVFQLADAAASFINFAQMQWLDVGVPFDFIHGSGEVAGISFADMILRNTHCFVDHANWSGGDAFAEAINGISIARVLADGYANHLIRLRGKDALHCAQNIDIADCDLNSHRQDGANFATGVKFLGYAKNATISRVSAYNCHDTQGNNPAAYWNGEGFAAEKTNDNLTFTDCAAWGCTDAGFDLKSSNTTLINPVAYDNKRNFRFWNNLFNVTNIDSRAPHGRGGIGSAAGEPLVLWGGSQIDGALPTAIINGGTMSDGRIQIGEISAPATKGLFALLLNGVTETTVDDKLITGSGSKIVRGTPVGAPVYTAPALNVDTTLHVRAQELVNPVGPLLSFDRPVAFMSATGLAGLTLADRETGDFTYAAPAYDAVTPANNVKDFVLTYAGANGVTANITVRLLIQAAGIANLFIAVANDNGAALSAGNQTALQNLETDMGAANADHDFLFPLALNSAVAQLMNFYSPYRTATQHGGTLTPGSGWTGDGATFAYLVNDAGFAPSGAKFALNSASGYAYCNQQNGGTGSRPHIGGDDPNSHFWQNACGDGTNENFQANDFAGSVSRVGADRKGMRGIDRPDAATKKAYFNGALVATVAMASGSIVGKPCLGRLNANYSSDRFGAWGQGRSLGDAKQGTAYTAVHNFLVALGAA